MSISKAKRELKLSFLQIWRFYKYLIPIAWPIMIVVMLGIRYVMFLLLKQNAPPLLAAETFYGPGLTLLFVFFMNWTFVWLSIALKKET